VHSRFFFPPTLPWGLAAQIKRSRSVRFEDDFGKSITGVIAIKSLDRLHSSQPIVIKSKNLLAAVKMIV
jgi:hypothetical protein